MAGAVGCSTRRWNCGGGRVARLGRSQDFSVEKFNAGQVVCGTGNDALPDRLETGRRREKKPTRCDPKCGQRVGAVAAVLEDDRMSMVSETDAAAVEAASSHLRVSGAGEAQQPGQRGCRTAHSAGPGRHARAERGVQHAPRFEHEFDGALFQTARSSGAGDLVGNVLTLWVRVVLHLLDGVRCAVFVKRVLSALVVTLTLHARSHRVDGTMHENLLCTSSGCRTACPTPNSPACDTGVHDAMQRVIRLGRHAAAEH